jgi:hypothetical protein
METVDFIALNARVDRPARGEPELRLTIQVPKKEDCYADC